MSFKQSKHKTTEMTKKATGSSRELLPLIVAVEAIYSAQHDTTVTQQFSVEVYPIEVVKLDQ